METINIMEAVSEWTGEDRLHDLLSHHYGLTLLKAKPVGGVVRIKTDRGSFALKRVRQGEKDRWKMLAELKQYLKDEKKSSVALPEITKSDKTFFRGFRFSYVLLPWVKGKPAEFRNEGNWINVTTALARFHKSSKDFAPRLSYRELSHAGKWSDRWEKEAQLSEIFHLAAKWTTMPTEADRFWLRTASYTTSILENLMEYYEKLGGDEVCLATGEHGRVCHGNLHGSNVVQDPDGEAHFVDWNEAVLDVRTHDLAQWLSYAYGKTGRKEVVKAILHAYQSVSQLTEEEYGLIYARFLYPERLIRTLESIYEREEHEGNYEVAGGVIKTLTKMEEKKAALLHAYAAVVKEEYKIEIPVLDWLHTKSDSITKSPPA